MTVTSDLNLILHVIGYKGTIKRLGSNPMLSGILDMVIEKVPPVMV